MPLSGPGADLGVHFYVRCEAATDDLVVSAGRVAVLSRRSPRKSTPNEDAAAVFSFGSATVLVVADGLGGRPGGADAAHTAVRTVHESLTREHGAPAHEAIPAALQAANRAVIAANPHSATTLAAVAIDAGVAHAFHIGDAGLLVVGGGGTLRLQTIAHSPVGYALEAGLLDERAAMSHRARHFISNVVGDPKMSIDASAPLALRPRDTVVLASDGLFDNLFTAEIADIVRRGAISTAVRALGDRCLERMTGPAAAEQPRKPDDLTIVAFRARGRPPGTSGDP